MTKPDPDRIALLQTFVRIVEAGSLSAAAAQLGATQPTISRRLQAFERTLGLRLLRRSTHAMKLTEDGERCYERARELLERWAAFEADLKGTGAEPEGRLRVIAPHAFGQHGLVELLAAFLRRYPRVTVEWLLHDGTPEFISQGVDCAIHVGAVDDPSLVAIRLAEVSRIVAAAPSVLDASSAPDEPEALAALPWLALQPFYRHEVILTHVRSGERRSLAIRPRVVTDNLYALRNAAVRGLGVGILSAWLLAEDLAVGRLVRLLPDWCAEPLPMSLIYPHARFYPARLRCFVELMRESIPAMLSR